MKYKKIYLDTNVILDFISQREPFAKAADGIFLLAQNNSIKLYCSVITITDLYFLLSKIFTKNKSIKLLKFLVSQVNLIGVKPEQIMVALDSEDFKDFEDAVQFNTAKDAKLDCIITRDKKGFKGIKSIKVMAPDEFLTLNEVT